MSDQVKSKQRVADHGEVFTAEREVNAMLDLMKQETDRVDSWFLEPACGDGNDTSEYIVLSEWSFIMGDIVRRKDFLAFGGENFKPTNIFALAEELFERLKKNVDVYETREVNRESEFYRTIMRERLQVA